MGMRLKKWHLLATAIILVIVSIGFSVAAVMASGPPVPPTMGFKVEQDYGKTYTGSLGTYIDIDTDGGATLPGWCADQPHDIVVGKEYTATLFDYFGQYYPNNLGALPAKISNPFLNWFAIAYILNHEVPGASMWDLQDAIWYFTPNSWSELPQGPNPPSANSTAMVNAAQAYLNSHGGIYVPGPGNYTPVAYYVDDYTQLIFQQYLIPNTPPSPLPEMSTFVLFGIGLAGLGGLGWLRFRKNHLAAERNFNNL
jgi:hypothetical protein